MQDNSAISKALASYPVMELPLEHGVLSYRRTVETKAGAPLLVLLHGIGSGSGSWLHQFQAFDNRLQIIAWDAPGYGDSDPLAGATPMADNYALALHKLVEANTNRPIILLGHSLGGLIAAAYAKRYPEHLKALVLASPAKGYGSESSEIRKAKWRDRTASLQQLGPEGLALDRGPALLHNAATDDALALVRWSMRRLRSEGYSAAAHCLAEGNILGDLADLKIPARVMCGDMDTITPPAGCREVAAALSGSDYVEISNAGHVLYVDQPVVFNDSLGKFLENFA